MPNFIALALIVPGISLAKEECLLTFLTFWPAECVCRQWVYACVCCLCLCVSSVVWSHSLFFDKELSLVSCITSLRPYYSWTSKYLCIKGDSRILFAEFHSSISYSSLDRCKEPEESYCSDLYWHFHRHFHTWKRKYENVCTTFCGKCGHYYRKGMKGVSELAG